MGRDHCPAGSESVKTRCLFAPAVNQTGAAALKRLFTPRSQDQHATVLSPTRFSPCVARSRSSALDDPARRRGGIVRGAAERRRPRTPRRIDFDLPDPGQRRLRARRLPGLGQRLRQVVANAWCEAQGFARPHLRPRPSRRVHRRDGDLVSRDTSARSDHLPQVAASITSRNRSLRHPIAALRRRLRPQGMMGTSRSSSSASPGSACPNRPCRPRCCASRRSRGRSAST